MLIIIIIKNAHKFIEKSRFLQIYSYICKVFTIYLVLMQCEYSLIGSQKYELLMDSILSLGYWGLFFCGMLAGSIIPMNAEAPLAAAIAMG